jgi:probable F420-dependent oxidoreductase
VKFLLSLPFAATRDPLGWAGARAFTDWAVAAESAGFDAVAVTDHPFPTDEWLAGTGHHAFDPFVVLTAFATVTQRIRLVTDILVAGYRNPYLLAKSIASTDIFSGGRLTVGIAAGYQRGEFDALGASYHDRGERFDEALEAATAALSGESVRRADGHYPASGNTMLPRPIQQPRPPIWIGGNANAAIRRAVQLADGWMPFHQTKERVAISGSPSLESLDELASRIRTAQSSRAEQGKPPLDICTSIFEDQREPEAAVARVPDYAEAGVTWIRVGLGGASLESAIARIEAFGKARRAATG